METVDTLTVFCTNRGPEVAMDQLDAVRWSSVGSNFTVIVDDRGDVGPAGLHGDHAIVHSEVVPRTQLSGFKNQEGLAWALRNGVDFRYALCLDDDCLPIGRGLDRWAVDVMDRDAVDLLGVRDRANYAPQWEELGSMIRKLVPESRGFRPDPEGVFYAICWMSRPFVDDLDRRRLLVPEGYEEWPSWPDLYVSWMAQVLGFSTRTWGTMDVPEPPLYANHASYMASAPQPWILREDFLAYHTVKSVTGADEWRIRDMYASRRRASSRP